MFEKIDAVVIAGPTASGKTNVALELSERIPIEIISADSRQIYKFLDIGTAKPNQDEINKVPHHYVDILNPDEYYSAGMFGNSAYSSLLEIQSRGHLPVVVGGSGLYIKALCSGFFEEDEIDMKNKIKIREDLERKLEEIGRDSLYQELVAIDASAAGKYIDKNPRRLIRALEHYYLTGKSITDSRRDSSDQRDLNCLYFGINHEREHLYERINQRTEKMWTDGLLEETRKVLELGYPPELNALNTVGYKETIAFIEGKIEEEDAIALIKQNTRRYAKRQMTWFRNQYDSMVWLDGSKNVTEEIVKHIEQTENKSLEK